MFLSDGSPSTERSEDNPAACVDTPSSSVQEQEGQEEDSEDVRSGDHHLHRVLGSLPCLLHPGLPRPHYYQVSAHR